MLFATTTTTAASKLKKSPPKKSHWKNGSAQKSVEKMQARGKTCFSD